MAQSSRTFRIFVSSTFSDLKAERNALQEKVFPRLRDLAATHGCRFQAIDLRWGVSEEAALDQQTMKICLGEIERCQKTSPRPNFIVLLGDRYGWRPLPYEIPASEFEQITNNISDLGERLLVASWYRRDDNAIPPAYCLQARKDEFIGTEKWESAETKIHSILEREAGKIHLSPDAVLKYTASATEQEIVVGALNVLDASEHVFCFLRDIQGLPENGYAANFSEADPEASRKQTELKTRLKQQLSDNFHEYKVRWLGDATSTEHLEQLCEDVYSELSKVILAEVGLLETFDQLEKEVSAHEAFGRELAQVFIGRADILKTISDYINGDDLHPLAVWGASGSGKSALLAKALEQACNNYSGKEIICRFIGATPDSSNGRALLEGLCRQIARWYGKEESTVPSEYKDLLREFPKCLSYATEEKPLALFVDALDQIADVNNARNLAWLPADLPPNVRFITSSLPGECLKALETKLPPQNLLEVQLMPLEDGKVILSKWLSGIRRNLQPDQMQYLLEKFKDSGIPLYFKLAFEEARLWKSYDGLPEMKGDVSGILSDLFSRLSHESNHGRLLVARCLGYLAVTRYGLSEEELLDVLSLDKEMLADFRRRSPKSPTLEKLPVVIWSRLFFDLEPYLSERSVNNASLLAFYHRQLGEVVAEKYLNAGEKRYLHKQLADYFHQRADPHTDDRWNGDYPRAFSEILFHLLESGNQQSCVKTFSSPAFIEHKVQLFDIHELLEDGNMLFKVADPEDWPFAFKIDALLRKNSRIFSSTPASILPTFQRTFNCSQPNRVENTQPDWFTNQLSHELTLRRWLATEESLPESGAGISGAPRIVIKDGERLKIINSHGAVFTIDARTNIIQADVTLGEFPVTVSQKGYCLTTANDKTHIWDLASGRCLSELPDSPGYGVFFQDTNLLFTWQQIGFLLMKNPPETKGVAKLRLWNIESGELVSSWDLHGPGTDFLASVSADSNEVFIGTSKGAIIKMPFALQMNEISISLSASAISSLWHQAGDTWGLAGNEAGEVWGFYFDSGRKVKIAEFEQDAIAGLDWGGNNIVYIATKKGQIASVSIQDGKTLWQKSLSAEGLLGIKVIEGIGVIVWNDVQINVLDTVSGEMINTIQITNGDLNEETDFKEVFYDPNSRSAIFQEAKGFRNVSDLHNLENWENEKALPVSSVRFTPNGPEFLGHAPYFSGKPEVHYWDNKRGLIHSFHTDSSSLGLTTWFIADSQICIIASAAKSFSAGKMKDTELWDLENGILLKTYLCHDDIHTNRILATDKLQNLICSANGPQVAVIDIKQNNIRKLVNGKGPRVTALVVNGEKEWIAYGCEDGSIILLSSETGEILWHLFGHYAGIKKMEFFKPKDELFLASISQDQTLRCWNLQTGDCIDTVSISAPTIGMTAWEDGELGVTLASGRTLFFNLVGS